MKTFIHNTETPTTAHDWDDIKSEAFMYAQIHVGEKVLISIPTEGRTFSITCNAS